MKIIYNNVHHRAGKLLLSLSLGIGLMLASCQRTDMDEVDPSKRIEELTKEELRDPIGNEFRLELTAEMSIDEDELRSIQHIILDRPGYEHEKYPQLAPKIGDQVSAHLVFLREKEDGDNTPIVFHKWVQMEVIDSKYPTEAQKAAGKGKGNILSYRGNIDFPDRYLQYSPANDYAAGKSKWHVMALLDYNGARIESKKEDAKVFYGRRSEDDVVNVDQLAMSMFNYTPSASTHTSPNGIPYISNWRPLRLTKNGKGEVQTDALDFVFKPQGTLIQVDMNYTIYDEISTRRVGLWSNVLDFTGYFDLTAEELYTKFAGRDPNTGMGVPDFIADEPDMGPYESYYLNEASELSSGERFYPWDMPTLSRVQTPTWGAGNYPGATKMQNPSGSFKATTILGQNQGNKAYSNDAYSWSNIPHMWRFMESAGSRYTLVYWGMPRPQAKRTGSPYTYVWTSAYSMGTTQDFFYGYDFDPYERILDAARELSPIRRQLAFYDEQIALYGAKSDAFSKSFAQQIEDLKQRYMTQTNAVAKMQQYTQDSTIYYGQLMPAYLTQRTARTQPHLVIYQTNSEFHAGKISHIQTAITTDLMISEVIYRKESGHNYSMLEIINPSRIVADLKQYAVARLIPNASDSYLQYRKADGSGTDKLDEAQILPLSSLVGGAGSPFANSQFSGWRTQLSGTDHTARYHKWASSYGSSALIRGMKEDLEHPNEDWYIHTTYKNRTDRDAIVLLPKQTLILGASGYINARPSTDQSAWYNELVNTKLYTADQRFHLRHAYAYADGDRQADGQYSAGTLDYELGQGFVLLRSNGKGGWQIIDTSAPIGRANMGSYRTYQQYKAWLSGQSADTPFSLERQKLNNFPALPPYNTYSLAQDNEDWIITDISNASIGYRDSNAPLAFRTSSFLLRRTPLDPTWTRYRTNIPVRQ